jgi:hypothetical protein
VAGLQLQIVGPQKAEIEALQKAFDEFIQAKGLSAEAVLAAYSDTSVPNLSSLACLVSMGGKKILLTGDARGDKVLAGLKQAKLLKTAPLKVDILKVPHHGSDRNTDADFFERIRADHYVFSANGKYGNPDRDTLQWVVDSRAKKDKYAIYLTYPIAEIDAARKADFAKKKKAWSAKKHSLKAFFADRKALGYAFTLHAGAPVAIELGDEAIAW